MTISAYDVHDAIVVFSMTDDPSALHNVCVQMIAEDRQSFDDFIAFLGELTNSAPKGRPLWEDVRYWPKLAELFG